MKCCASLRRSDGPSVDSRIVFTTGAGGEPCSYRAFFRRCVVSGVHCSRMGRSVVGGICTTEQLDDCEVWSNSNSRVVQSFHVNVT